MERGRSEHDGISRSVRDRNDLGRPSSGLYRFSESVDGLFGVARPERDLQQGVRGQRGIARQDALRILERLPLNEAQRERLSDLRPQADLVGEDADLISRYLVWWNRFDGLVRNIQSTPVQALSDTERDALKTALSIARLETEVLGSRLHHAALGARPSANEEQIVELASRPEHQIVELASRPEHQIVELASRPDRFKAKAQTRVHKGPRDKDRRDRSARGFGSDRGGR